MGRATRVCRRMYESEGWALPAIVGVWATTLVFETSSFAFGSGSTVRPYEWNLNMWLMLALGASYAAWSFLRARGAVDASAGQWFVLAAYGVWMRTYCFFVVFHFMETFGNRSLVEEFSGHHGRVLIAFHRYGGLVAFVLGLAMVAWFSRRPGRAAIPPSRRRRRAGPAGRARPADGRPS